MKKHAQLFTAWFCAALLCLGSTALAAPQEAIALTDQAGRNITLQAPAQKIVSGYYISTSACIALGLEDRLVGIEAKAASRPMYQLAAPSLLSLPDVGTAKEFNLEGCLALEPDLVILPKRLKDSADTIEALGIPVLLVNPESQQELIEMLQLIGVATGASDRAEALVRLFTQEMEAIQALLEGVQNKPVVYMGANSSYLSTAPKSMYQADIIAAAGGTNAGSSLEGTGWTEVSYEQLLALAPEVLVLPSEASYSKEDILADRQLAALTAVAEGQVYQMPKDFESWDSPTLSSTLGIRWLVAVLHGDLYSMESMQQDAAAFYQQVYGCSIDAALIGK